MGCTSSRGEILHKWLLVWVKIHVLILNSLITGQSKISKHKSRYILLIIRNMIAISWLSYLYVRCKTIILQCTLQIITEDTSPEFALCKIFLLIQNRMSFLSINPRSLSLILLVKLSITALALKDLPVCRRCFGLSGRLGFSSIFGQTSFGSLDYNSTVWPSSRS